MKTFEIYNEEEFKKWIKEILLEHLKASKIAETKIEEYFLTTEEVCSLLKISRGTLWKMTKNDVIPAVRIGNILRYNKTQILSMLDNNNKIE